jgi:mannitol/fructose-specific phosphotransferase system IIA component (Ntr-type)
MMVDFRQIIDPHVLLFGGLYALVAILAKLLGCGGPALLLGFNVKGTLRIGLGMAPRGEMTLILAGIGLALPNVGLNQSNFAELVLMVLITTLAVPPLLNAMLKLRGRGTRKSVKDLDTVSLTWDFPARKITELVVNTLLDDLRAEGFYVQMMNRSEGICQARKDDISLSIQENENKVTIKTTKPDAHFVKTVVYEVIVELYEYIGKLRESSDPLTMKKSLLESTSRTRQDLLSFIQPESTSIQLRGANKIEIITELVDMLDARGKLLDRATVLADVLEREDATSTGMEHGIALPHAKTDGVDDLEVAVGIKREGVDFGSMDGKKSQLFILIISPKKTTGPHIQFLATISALLRDETLREKVVNAAAPEEAVALLRAEK